MDVSYQPIPLDRRCKDGRTIPDLTGRRFDRWLVLGFVETVRTERLTRYYWHCRCDCGVERLVVGASLVDKKTPSRGCGCAHAERLAVRNTKHGLSAHPCYAVRANMIRRCTDPRDVAYHRYGARGIKVCDRWLASLENFIEDMGSPPFEGAQIDRFPDNDGNYEKSNCRWATCVENMNNMSCNVVLEHDGKRLTASAWADLLGIPRPTVYDRIAHGWPVAEVLTVGPTRHKLGADEAHGSARLTADQVREIRQRHQDGERASNLARAFGVSKPSIAAIVKRKTWRHI